MKKRLYILTCIVLAFSFFASLARAEVGLSDEQIYLKDISRIEKYLNNIGTLVSSFTQTTESGEFGQGVFYLSRPGKIRWEHYAPNPVIIIVKNSRLTYYDQDLDQISHIGLDDSLASFLTNEIISFDQGNVEVSKFEKDDKEIAVTIIQKDQPDAGSVTLVFGNERIYLKKMKVIDSIGKLTEVLFDTIVYDKPIDKKLFSIEKRKNKK